MDLLRITLFAGYGLGCAVHIALLRLIAKRASRREGEGLLLLIAVALLVWNGANLGQAGILLLTGGLPADIERWLDLVGACSAALVPSLILHMLARLHRGVWRGLVVLAYLPPVGIAAAGALGARGVTAALGGWLTGALAIAAGLSLRLSLISRLRAEAHEGTARFYRYLGGILAVSAAIVATIIFGSLRRADSPGVELLVVVASVVPTSAIAYGLHRYYDVRTFLRRNAVELALAVLLVGLYLQGLVRLAHHVHTLYGFDVATVEGAGLLLVVIAFHPFRRRVLDALAWVLDPAGRKEHELSRLFAEDLGRPGALAPSELCARLAHGVQEALDLELAAFCAAAKDQGPIFAAPPQALPYRALLDATADLGGGVFYRRGAIPDVEVSRALAERRVDFVYPLDHQGARMGLLALGRGRDGALVDPRELQALDRLAPAIAQALSAARLVDEKLALEVRLREEDRLASLGRLAATIAHRVKNPLASIKAIVQALREDLEETDARREDLEVVVSEVDRLTHVVSELLGFARAGTREPGPTDARELLEETRLLMQHHAAQSDVRLELVGSAPVPLVRAEASGLREVLSNLVENAIIASPPGSRVEIAAAEADGAVEISVADEGPGVPAELAERIFEPFFTTRTAGTGLGLAVSRRRVEAWGGTLRLDTARERGARFVATLPRAEEESRDMQQVIKRMEVAADLAWRAGQRTLAHFRGALEVERKSDESPVTIADRGAEAFLREAIAARYPSDAILGEEEGETEGTSGWRWVLDPIDGTKSFVHGVPLYGVMVACEDPDGDAVIGAISFPPLGELVVAGRGQGCFVNGRRARVTTTERLSEACICYTDLRTFQDAGKEEVLLRLSREARLVRGWGDCYGHVLVATGRADAALDPWLADWDAAPLLPIVEEAGGRFTDWSGARTAKGGSGISTNGRLALGV